MNIPCLPRIICIGSILLKKKEVLSAVLVISMIAVLIPEIAYADNFWDKVKEAAKKSQQQQQQNTSQRQTAPISSSSKTQSTNLKNAAVGGVKLGMTPDQVERIFKESPKKYKVSINNYSVHGNNFVGSILARLEDSTVKKSLGGGAFDDLRVEFAVPPHANTVVAISRKRTFGLNEQAPPYKIEAAIFNKYGTPNYNPDSLKKYKHIGRYVWRDRSSKCDGTALRDGPTIGDIYQSPSARMLRDGSWNCPVFMFIKRFDGKNMKTNKFDYTHTLDTVLADFPTIVESNRKLSEVTRKINEKESLERARKSAPTDI